MSNNKYIQAIKAADQLTIKALRAEFDDYKRQAECAARS